MNNNSVDFIDYINGLLKPEGIGFSQVLSETKGVIEISTQKLEDSPHQEKILIELENPVFSSPNTVRFSSIREMLFNDPEIDRGIAFSMLELNRTPYHAHYAIFEDDGRKSLGVLAIANSNLIDTELIMAIIVSILKRRIEYRSFLNKITGISY